MEHKVKDLIEERDKLEKHREDKTGFLRIEFRQDGQVMNTKVDATMSPVMLDAGVMLLVEKASMEHGIDIYDYLQAILEQFDGMEDDDE